MCLGRPAAVLNMCPYSGRGFVFGAREGDPAAALSRREKPAQPAKNKNVKRRYYQFNKLLKQLETHKNPLQFICGLERFSS